MSACRLAEMNKVLLSGRLTRDPEVRYSPAGIAVATLALAVNRHYSDATGAWRESTTFVTVSAFRRTAELAGERLQKGSAVLVEGMLHSRSWTGSDGRPHSVLEVRADRVQFLDARVPDAEGADADAGDATSPGAGEHTPGSDLPF